MATTYIDKSVTHIKISRVDEQGNDNTLSLQELDSIRIITQDPDLPEYLDFAITSISEFPTYYLYEISPSTQPLATYGTDTILNSVDSNIPDCTFYAERTTPFTIAPNSVDGTGGEITGYNITYTSSPNTFNSSTGIYTVGVTPNIYTTTTASITIQSSQGGSIRLAIVDANTGETAALSDLLSTPLGVPVTHTFSSSFPLSGSIIVENLLETTQYRVDVIGNGSGQPYTISNFSWAITQSIAAKSSPAYNSVILEPYLYDVFEYSDCNVLINNATEPQYDSDFFKVNYDTGQSIPTNQIQILQGTAERAPVNPSNYTSRAQIYPRYNGTKTTAPNFNTSSNDGTGYGGLVVAGNPAPFIGYYTSKGGSTPEVLKKTIINLDYIIDENISTQVPALSDFTIDTQKGLYPRGGYLYLDPDKNSALEQFAGNNKYKIYRSGEYATPILYSQTGSNPIPINQLTFTEPGLPQVNNYLKSKYTNNNPNNSSTGFSGGGAIKDRLFARWNTTQYMFNSIPYDYEEIYGPIRPDEVPGGVFATDQWYNKTWNQLPFNIVFQGDEVTFNTINTGGVYISDLLSILDINNIPPDISFKVKFSITLSWNPSGNYYYAAGFMVRGNSTSGWNFQKLTPEPQSPGANSLTTLQPGDTTTITIETDILTPSSNLSYIFIQGLGFSDFEDTFQPDINSSNRFDAYDQIRSWLTISNPILEIIQIPEPTVVDINLTPSTPYITQVLNSLDLSTPEGNSSLAFIQFTSSFAPVLGKIYPQIPNSGYDSTIYPFEFPQNYELDSISTFAWLLGGASTFGTNGIEFLGNFYPTQSPPPGTFDYEIRFNADENQTYPIIGYYYDENNSNLALIILRPRTAILTSDTADGPVPIENYQSFLIRRWIPRAGYIYLDVDASLGKGIVKPEFITDGIQVKIPQIVKELTDKGLIT